jgi:hypothetical protein
MKFTVFPRKWQERRIACTEDVIAFARVGGSTLLDAIPLHEVISIESMLSVDRGEQDGQHTLNSYESVIDFTHAFQVRTVKNGQNAGRKYILRVGSDEEVTTITEELSLLTKKAARKKEMAAKSWKANAQNIIRKLYSSSVFQGIFALLIVAVNADFCCFQIHLV